MSDSLDDRFPRALHAASEVFPAPPDTLIDRGIARGRQMRRRRAIPVLATLGVAAVAAVVVALPSGAAPPNDGAAAATSARGVNVDLAAWSVHTNADASVTVTVHQMLDPDALRGVLAKAGVRADVLFIKAQWLQPICLPAVNAPGVTEAQAERVLGIGDPRSTQAGELASFTIHPAAMPAGSRISFTIVDWGPAHPKMISIAVLVRAPQPCTGAAK